MGTEIVQIAHEIQAARQAYYFFDSRLDRDPRSDYARRERDSAASRLGDLAERLASLVIREDRESGVRYDRASEVRHSSSCGSED